MLFVIVYLWDQLSQPGILWILALLAIISPLLAFIRLFQLKEWRIDRLREHLRREGWLHSLYGKARIRIIKGLILISLIACVVLFALGYGNYLENLLTFFIVLDLLLFLYANALITILQGISLRLRMPVWTQKAILITGISICFTMLAATSFISMKTIAIPLLSILPVIQPLMVLFAWFLLLPLDRFLKHRTFQQARLIRKKLPNPIVIGIAGSVGKTTVKELLATVLADLHPLTTPEHVNTEMGVSQWIIRTLKHSKLETRNSKLLIIEMGAYRKGEIALLSSIVQPTLGIVTALGSDHLALFGSEEAIIEANGELIEALPPDGHAFLYGDNPSTQSLTTKSPCPVTLAGIETHNDLQAHAITDAEHALSFETRTRNNQITTPSIAVPIHGTHNVGNALLAIAVARHLGITDDRIKKLLATHQPLHTTFNVRSEQGVLLLDDTYNISPLSLRAAIDWAGTRTERPRILLTSGLLETGPAEDRFHEELGACAKGKLERVIFTTDRGRAAFVKGYGSAVELLTTTTEPAPAGGTLLCVGRMTPATMRRLMLPVKT